ncbi:MAG: GNAT family N-acetyltransferase [Anaerolineales bacterium]
MRRPDSVKVRDLLEADRVWCAYALADLDPEYYAHAHWMIADRAVVLVYSGLTPPVLFAHGDPGAALELLRAAPPAAYQYTLLPTHRTLLGAQLKSEKELRMWRMALRRQDFHAEADPRVTRLTPSDLDEMTALFTGHPDSPDSFHSRQLEGGPFFGLREQGELKAVAGVHVVSKPARLAAVGNVFTHPESRGRGMSRAVSSAVVDALFEDGIETIVLNVSMQNDPALRVYRRLGFMPFCGYYEGVGVLLDLTSRADGATGDGGMG